MPQTHANPTGPALDIPGPTPTEYGPELRDHILDGFVGRLRPVQVTPVYHLALVVVAMAMIFLPLVYIAIIGLTGWAVIEHAINNLTLFETVDSARGAFFLYATPIFVGIVAVAFLIKPLFAGRVAKAENKSLSAMDEPILFAFVEKLCTVVGAPTPTRIDVDSQVNASASFRRGMWSMAGNDLVLTIGLPLVRGLSLQQFAGVLAHEFGHFAQGAGMRLSYVIRSINAWFARVVYQRDAWDEQLEKATRTAGHSWLIYIMLQLSRGMVWLTRRVLWALMQLGHGLSCFLMRQMEFDADRYEARLAGADTFAETARELNLLGMAQQGAMHDLSVTWQDGHLVDSLPELIMVNRQTLPEHVIARADQAQQEEKTGTFDTHPADRDRIAGARKETDAPSFRTDLPATALFRDFHGLAVENAQTFYRDNLGQSINTEHLLPADQVLRRSNRQNADRQAFARIIQAALDLDRGLPLADVDAPPTEPALLLARLRQSRSALAEGAEPFRNELAEWEELVSAGIQMAGAREALEAGLKIDADDFELPKGTLDAVSDRQQELDRRATEIDLSLSAREHNLADRLRTALAVLDVESLEAENPDFPELRQERDRLLPVAEQMARRRDRLAVMRRTLGCLGFVISQDEHSKKLKPRAEALAGELHRALNTLIEPWTLPYPFENRLDDRSLAAWIIAEPRGLDEARALLAGPPDQADPQAMVEVAQSSLNRCYEVYGRVLARLTFLAERGERALGFDQD